MMSKRTTEQLQVELQDALAEAALAGAREIREFLAVYRGKDPDRLRRVHVAMSAVSGFTRYRASQNNMIAMMLSAARQTGVPPEQTLELAKASGILPESVETAAALKVIAKP
jgi:hypothetical protein